MSGTPEVVDELRRAARRLQATARLRDGATTPGEREAADQALERLVTRMAELVVASRQDLEAFLAREAAAARTADLREEVYASLQRALQEVERLRSENAELRRRAEEPPPAAPPPVSLPVAPVRAEPPPLRLRDRGPEGARLVVLTLVLSGLLGLALALL